LQLSIIISAALIIIFELTQDRNIIQAKNKLNIFILFVLLKFFIKIITLPLKEYDNFLKLLQVKTIYYKKFELKIFIS